MGLEDRKSVYGNVSIKFREKSNIEVKKSQGEVFNRKIARLMELIQIVPHWEISLTDKQLEAVKAYLKYKDAAMCDDVLKLTEGSTRGRIFGIESKVKGTGGAMERLEKAYKRLGGK